jgi:hypothetical protein
MGNNGLDDSNAFFEGADVIRSERRGHRESPIT